MNALIEFSLRHRVLMLVLFVMIFAGGIVAFRQLNIEAYPDPTPPMVDVVTQSPGLSAEEIERYITIPIETQTAAVRNLTSIRTISLYGLSDVKLQFSFDYTYDEALQQVLNRLSQLPPLPNNVQPRSPRSARSARSIDTSSWGRRDIACSISRRCRIGCCSGASGRCPASST